MNCSRQARAAVLYGLALLLAPLAAGQAQAKDPAVKLQKQDKGVEITIGGEPFAFFSTSKEYPKPFFSPVRSEGGAIITRGLEKPEDHPHHKGVWISVDEVNGIKFWAEKGRIENQSVEIAESAGAPAGMKITNHWLGEDGKPLLVETTDVKIFPNRLMAFDIHFTPAKGAGLVTFEDTKEGLFGIRLGNTVREKGSTGQVVNDEGVETSTMNWGKHSKWIDYSGPVDGKIHGAAIFDHPENPRPSRYHVRNYGLFTISPFGEKSYTNGKQPAAPVQLSPGQTYRLRYALYVHPGDAEQAKVADVYAFWLKNS